MFGRKFLLLKKKIHTLKTDEDFNKENLTQNSNEDVVSHTQQMDSLSTSRNLISRCLSVREENGASLTNSQSLAQIFGIESERTHMSNFDEVLSENTVEDYTLSKFKQIVNDNSKQINKLIGEIQFKREQDLNMYLNRRNFQVYYNERFFLYPNVTKGYHKIKYVNRTNRKMSFGQSYLAHPIADQFEIQKVEELFFESNGWYVKEKRRLEEREIELTSESATVEADLIVVIKENERLQRVKEIYFKLLHQREEHRKGIHEYCHSIKGNIRVHCRIKPTKEGSVIRYPELIEHSTFDCNNLTCVEMRSTKGTNDTCVFNFDRVFNESSTQEDIFHEVKQFIQSALDGENVCLFAYGSTGSGKTFTMQGNYTGGALSPDSGILPRCAEFIFSEANRVAILGLQVKISFCAYEIYNENIYDLLVPQKKGFPRQPLAVYLIANETGIKNLSYVTINSKEDIIKYTKEASESRRSDSTQFNSTSSRSHGIFQIKLEISNHLEKKTSVISIVDLAGNERSSLSSFGGKSKEEIELAKRIQTEANFINKSLTTLGRVISLIGDKKNTKVAVPYRESKLTMVLQNYLKPNSKTVMIVTACSDQGNFNLAKESLKFATNAMINC